MNNYAKKKFSQNFLNDENILNSISSVIDIENKNIIEIGPGKGALTKILLKRAKKVVAFEIDNNLFNFLSSEIKNEKLELINKDFLKINLEEYHDFQIVSNIPYNISTDIVFKIFNNFKNFSDVVLLVQKEFAQRLCAKVNSKDYSKLTVSTKLYYDAKKCFDVNPNSFWPKPKVFSSVVHLKRRNIEYNFDHLDFLNFIKQCFSMKRKTLWNNVKNLTNQEKFNDVCFKMKIDNRIRPQELSLDQFIFFYNEFKIK